MEFLDYANATPMLRKEGIVVEEEGDLLRLGVDDQQGVTRRIVIGTPNDSESQDETTSKFEVARNRLADIAEGVVQRLHLPEAALIPVKRWQDVLDVAAFDLATDEAWLDIDAEAAMHQNGRDPLLILPNSRHLIRTIVAAIMSNGESQDHEIIITALDSLFLMHVRHTGELDVRCANDAVADMVRGVVQA